MTIELSLWNKAELVEYTKHYATGTMAFGIGVAIALQQIIPLKGFGIVLPIGLCIVIISLCGWKCSKLNAKKQAQTNTETAT